MSAADEPAEPQTASLLDFDAVGAAEWDHVLIGRAQAGIEAKGTCRDSGIGLALSGGGIRSATFCLGVIQALAKARQLRNIDYLSTVSGGGYVGCWLTTWIHRHPEGLKGVEEELRRQPSAKSTGEASPIAWLRRYSNYMSPRLGLLSGDTVTLVTTWLRNVLLNLTIVVAFFACVLLLPRLLVEPTIQAMTTWLLPAGYAATWIAFFILPLTISLNLSPDLSRDTRGDVLLMNTTWGVVLAVILPGMFTAYLGSAALFAKGDYFRTHLPGFARLASVLLAAAAMTWLVYQLWRERQRWRTIAGEATYFAFAYAGALAVGTVVIGAFAKVIHPIGTTEVEKAANVLTFGTPALLATFGIVGSVIVGFARPYSERSREWWARMNAWFAIVGVSWLVVCALAFYAAPVARWAWDQADGWFATLLGAGWLASLLTTLLGPRPSGSDSITGRLGRFGLSTALSIVVAGLLFAIAAAVGLALEQRAATSEGRSSGSVVSVEVAAGDGNSRTTITAREPLSKFEIDGQPGRPTVVTLATQSTPISFQDYVKHSFTLQEKVVEASARGIDFTAAAALVCLVVLLLFGRLVDVNKFSLHALYMNRLVRCYLGASRRIERRPNPFTGFDEDDDVPLHVLRGIGPIKPERSGTPKDKRGVLRPFPIINAALNLTQGSNLAWQERKAASFTFSPLHCGFALGPSTGDAHDSTLWSGLSSIGGYRFAKEWASKGDERHAITIGSAMAVSGAAASSISGKSTLPALAFIATLFNARLGRWSPNPLRRSWDISSPRAGLYYLLSELFGHATERTRFVYLSDGGHFDNTGAYELVRRRCRFVIVVDATADAVRSMGDLANLVRKCRIDFGVRIDFDVDELGTEPAAQGQSKGFVFGTIHYGDGSPDGSIVVIKPTLSAPRRLGVDLFSYARSSKSFPHQTTIDQFFSESQFESYRELGERIGKDCLGDSRFGEAMSR